MTPAQAQERWPGMKFDDDVLFSRDGGTVQADGSIRAMYKCFEELGGRTYLNTRVEDIEISGDVAVVVTSEGTFRTKSVVVSAGAWFEKLVGGKVKLPKIVVELGQPTHFTPLSGYEDPSLWPAFIHHADAGNTKSSVSGGAYGMYTPGVGLKVGFEEEGHLVDPDNRDFSINRMWNQNTKNYVREWFPGVDPETADPVTCLFTNTPNSDFILDRQGPLTVVSACSGHGFKFTPRIGQIAADLACGSTQHIKEWRFRTA
jgi:sarcosine oxidase